MKGQYPKTMKALVCYGKGDYKYEEAYPTPECGPDDIIIKTEACGVCIGDIKTYHGAERIWGGDMFDPWAEPPFIPGHEFLGTIVALGDNVDSYEIGERITADQIAPCGKCKFCRSGRYWMCEPHRMYGYQKQNNGGMAEYVRYKSTAMITRVPAELPLDKATLIEPFGCAKHCVDRAQITNEDVVVISGAGTLGQGMITYARMKNPDKLIVLDLKDERLEKAKEFGADIVLNPSKCNVVEEIKKLTDGYGCDIYIEAVGHPSSVSQGMLMLRKLGRFVEFGVFAEPTVLDWSIIGDGKELDILGSHLSPYAYPFVVKHMLSGEIKTDGLLKTWFELKDWEKAFEYATGKYGDFKVAFRFD